MVARKDGGMLGVKENMDISKKDWKLFCERVPGWQEHYMEQLGKGQIKCVAQELRVRIAQVEQNKKKLACLTPKPGWA